MHLELLFYVLGNIVWTLFKGPLEACVGVACGVVGGILMWYIPQRSSVSCLYVGLVFALIYFLDA